MNLQNKKKKRLTIEQAKDKLEHYCAYQERCHSEVKQKLWTLGFWGDWAESVIEHLIDENFLDEERYVCSFVRSKFKYKKWGRRKILMKLKQKRISQRLIDHGFKEIDEEEYLQTLDVLIEKKRKVIREENPFKRNQKLANYLIQKGYEMDLIWKKILG